MESTQSGRLRSEFRSTDQFSPLEIQALYALYATYYGGTDPALFTRDFSDKTHVQLLRTDAGEIRGFSTILMYERILDQAPCTILFSGDTIIDPDYWARNDFASAWLHFAYGMKKQNPHQPLYWFLIVKGHRTYRYLNIFARHYYPSPHEATPADVKIFMDELASERFGADYDPDRGVVSYDATRDYLKAPWVDIPQRLTGRPEVRFFEQQNAGYKQGDELVCLCEISEANMKPMTRRLFRADIRADIASAESGHAL